MFVSRFKELCIGLEDGRQSDRDVNEIVSDTSSSVRLYGRCWNGDGVASICTMSSMR
jgi:hypothetical protein